MDTKHKPRLNKQKTVLSVGGGAFDLGGLLTGGGRLTGGPIGLSPTAAHLQHVTVRGVGLLNAE